MRFARRDWLVAGGLFVVAFALRLPFRSVTPWHWDSAQYALAVTEYDVAIGQPQPPGYFLYVMLGRLVNVLVGDAHTSLVWVSVVAGAALAALGYGLGRELFGRGCGVVTGAVLASSPLCWFHSCVALTNIVDALLVSALAWAGLRALGRPAAFSAVAWVSVWFALVAGNRPQSAVMMLPLWGYVVWRGRWRRVVFAAVVAAVVSAVWFVPMVLESGGVSRYWEALKAKASVGVPFTPWGGKVANAIQSASLMAASCWLGLLLGGLFAVPGLVCGALRRSEAWGGRCEQFRLLGVWIVPAVLFGVGVYTLMPGQVLTFFPALAVLVGWALARLRWPWVVAAVLGNAVVFVWDPWPVEGVPLTARAIRAQDERMARACALVRQRYEPAEVVLCHRQQFFFWGMRQFQYQLPQYTQVLLARDLSVPAERAGMYRVCRGARTEFVPDWREVVRGKVLLLFVAAGDGVGIFRDRFDVSDAVRLTEGVYELRVPSPVETNHPGL